MSKHRGRNIWIDLDNSPHVPFFKPIIDELRSRGYPVTVTARDCFQVCGLADMAGMTYRRIGKHYGKHKVFKALGLAVRAAQTLPTVLRERPAVAVSHGSRTQQIVATVLRIPNIMIFDYEHATALSMFPPDVVIVPEVIADSAIRFRSSRVFKYPGIKEDVYVPGFRPERGLRAALGIRESDVLVTIRPPASEAHYRSPESDRLFSATVEAMAAADRVRMVMLPRNERQAERIRQEWPALCAAGKILIPEHVVDGLNLIWNSDVVISGGGTMNREAAALGVPVYSIFRGTTGAVDRYLAESGRLTLLETVADVQTKIQLVSRVRDEGFKAGDRQALTQILSVIERTAAREQ